MKTLIEMVKLGVLFTGLIILFSCSSNTKLAVTEEITAVYRTIPAISGTVSRFTENKISEYLRISSGSKSKNGNNGKKVGKGGNVIKPRPVSIGVIREVRLV
jgi:hypothetical protein